MEFNTETITRIREAITNLKGARAELDRKLPYSYSTIQYALNSDMDRSDKRKGNIKRKRTRIYKAAIKLLEERGINLNQQTWNGITYWLPNWATW